MFERGLRILAPVGVIILTSTLCLAADPEGTATKEVLRILSDRNAYDPALRPSQDGKKTTVKLQMVVEQMSIDTHKMRARFDIIFRMQWTDQRLTFKQPGIAWVRIRNPDLLWIPDAYFITADVSQRHSIHKDDFARVTSNGSIVYSTRLTVEERCQLKHRSFPHDTQECCMSVSSHEYSRDKVELLLDEDDIEVSEDLDLQTFTLEGYKNSYILTSASTGDFIRVDVRFDLRRSVWPCLSQLYLPAMMLVMVSWFSFLLPPDQALGRLLLCLAPLVTLSGLCRGYFLAVRPVSHLRAAEVFAGSSLSASFATLLHLVVFDFFLNAARDKQEVLEAGGGKRRVPSAKTGARSGSRFRAGLRKTAQPARYVILGSYSLFLLIYFLFYCADDGERTVP